MAKLTPEELKKFNSAFNAAFTDKVLNSSKKFDKLKDINKQARKEIAKRNAEARFKGTSFTPNLNQFMPSEYNKWYHFGTADDKSDIMDTINYMNMLAGNAESSEESLRDYSDFIFNLYSSTNQRFSDEDLGKLYNYFIDKKVGTDQDITYTDTRGVGINSPIEFSKDFRNYSNSMYDLGAQPSVEHYLNSYILNKQKLENEIKQIENPSKFTNDTINAPKTPKEEIPKENEVTNTTPEVKTKPTEDIGDLYTYTMNRLSKDKKYRKLGW